MKEHNNLPLLDTETLHRAEAGQRLVRNAFILNAILTVLIKYYELSDGNWIYISANLKPFSAYYRDITTNSLMIILSFIVYITCGKLKLLMKIYVIYWFIIVINIFVLGLYTGKIGTIGLVSCFVFLIIYTMYLYVLFINKSSRQYLRMAPYRKPWQQYNADAVINEIGKQND